MLKYWLAKSFFNVYVKILTRKSFFSKKSLFAWITTESQTSYVQFGFAGSTICQLA